MNKFFFYISISICTLAISCKQSNYNSPNSTESGKFDNSVISTVLLTPPEYVTWCQNKENKLKKLKEIEELTFSLQYKPAEYVVCMEEKADKISTNSLKEKLSELQGLDYYDFKIEVPSAIGELLKYNVSTPSEYNQRVNYFAFDMQHDVKLLDGNDTLDCMLFHFERAYDIAPSAIFLLGFPKTKSKNSQRTFFYQDKVFNKGIIKFTYTKDELSQIPKLKTI